jgi:sec-independent protein translocase protein TatA
MGSVSIWHWIIVIAVVLLVFGRGKISELMGDVAQGIKAFKKGMQDDETPAADAPKADPLKTIDHQAVGSAPAAPVTPAPAATVAPAAPVQAQTERRFEGGTV